MRSAASCPKSLFPPACRARWSPGSTDWAPVREIAQEAAAIGREFPYELLAAVTERDEKELVNGLDRLVEADLVQQGGLPPEASYSFKHSLVQDAAYSMLLRTKRKALHARIARHTINSSVILSI